MNAYEREYEREHLDIYVADPDNVSLRELKSSIDAVMDSNLDPAIKDALYLFRRDHQGGWTLMYDRPETDREWQERTAGEIITDWTEMARLARKLLNRPEGTLQGIDHALQSIAEYDDDLLKPGRRLTDRQIREAVKAAIEQHTTFGG